MQEDTNENMSNGEILMLYYDFMIELFDKWGCPDDLRQMVYLDFLECKDNEKLNRMHREGQLKFWIVRFIKNYWFSKTSRYYTTYGRYYDHIDSLDSEETGNIDREAD